jgi:hypothetical protein
VENVELHDLGEYVQYTVYRPKRWLNVLLTEFIVSSRCPIDLLAPQSGLADELRWGAGHRYRVRGDIPRLLAKESTYADAFGERWIEYRITQLDSYTRTDISKERLRRCLGETLWGSLQKPGRVEILESGCGAGRFTEILLQPLGAKNILVHKGGNGVEARCQKPPKN